MKWIFWSSILLVVSLLLGLSLFAYAMYALLAAMLVSRVLTHSWIHNLAAERTCNRTTANVGDTVAVIVTIKNQGVLPVGWALLEDVLPKRALIFDPPNLRVLGVREKLISLGSRGSASMLYQLECNRRGFYQIGPLVMETGDLFGLHRRFRVGSQPHFLMVYPKVVQLSGYELASRRPLGEIRLTHRLFEDPTRIAGVRQYQQGDSLNRINWRATARTGVLHSKVYEASCVAGVNIVLDFHRDSHDRRQEPFRSELAITVAASLANAVFEMGQQVGLLSNCRDAADRIRLKGWDFNLRSREAARKIAGMRDQSDRLRAVLVETRRGPEQLMRIFESLARAELTDGLTFSQLLLEYNSRLRRDATVVAILTSLTEAAAISLGSLKRQGYAVSVILNMYDDWDFGIAAGALAAQGIVAHQLKEEANVAEICRSFLY
jgi:uncharacterized repeat protein (TIGR01451 family)